MKSNEQILNKYVIYNVNIHTDKNINAVEFNNALSAMEEARNESKWVDVSERLPELDRPVLIYWQLPKKDGHYDMIEIASLDSITIRNGSKTTEWRDSDYNYKEPTHWAELPSIPTAPIMNNLNPNPMPHTPESEIIVITREKLIELLDEQKRILKSAYQSDESFSDVVYPPIPASVKLPSGNEIITAATESIPERADRYTERRWAYINGANYIINLINKQL